MESRIAGELKLRYQPVALLFTNERPAGAVQFAEGKWGCVIAMLTAAAKGKTAVFDRKTVGCAGGITGLGFGCGFEKLPGGIDYFLSCGRGEGFPEGEGYRKTPEIARGFIDSLPITDIPYTYIVFKPLSAVDPERETPQLIIFYATPDQLTALVTLANYETPGTDNVIIPQAAGCQSIGIIPYREAQQEHPRAVVGLLDSSARPFVPADLLSFTVPFRMFQTMEANIPGSFLERSAWQKVRARIPDPGAE